MTLTSRLKEIAHRHGFDVVRIAEASPLVDAARTMHTRLASGHLDGMPALAVVSVVIGLTGVPVALALERRLRTRTDVG